MALLVMTSASFAQKAVKVSLDEMSDQRVANVEGVKVQQSKAALLPRMTKKSVAKTTAKQNRRTISTGVYYNHPAGTLFGGWNMGGEGDDFGVGYSASTIVVPTCQYVTFENKTQGESTWSVGETTLEEQEKDFKGIYMRGKSGEGISLFRAPTVTSSKVGAGSYTFGEYNGNAKKDRIDPYGLIRVDSMNTMYAADPMAAIFYQGKYYGPYMSWGLFDNDNLYGSGNYVDEKTSESTPCYASFQYFQKPASPLFLTKIIIGGESSSKPIADGKKLSLVITKVKLSEKTYGDGTKEWVKMPDMDNVIATMEAESNDTIDFFNTTERNSKTLKAGYVVFKKPGEKNILGKIIPGNIVLDEEFIVAVIGLDEEGIDFGIDGIEVEEYDDTIVSAQNLLKDGMSFSYKETMVMDIGLYGMFDGAYVEAQPGSFKFEDPELDYRIVSVPVEGSSNVLGYGNMTYGATASPVTSEDHTTGTGYIGAAAFMALPWFDGDENENYSIMDEMDSNDWITSYAPIHLGYGFYNISFFAEPLPTGQTGRYAVVRIIGQEADMDGVKKYSAYSNPIAIVQGDVDINEVKQALANGIDAVTVKRGVSTFSNATFNMAGQRVNDSYKGLVIKNGVKYMKK